MMSTRRTATNNITSPTKNNHATMATPESKCPYQNRNKPKPKPKTVRDWWPDSLDLRILHQDPISARPSFVPHPSSSSVASILTRGGSFASYADKFNELDLHSLRNGIYKALTTSNPDWPADYGHYGPLMVRLAWHSAGTYRVYDGRGGGNSGNIRLAPLNSWPDNANLDKARRYILWPIKQKYGQAISWGDLIILAGNVALESMMINGGETWEDTKPLWFGGGRIDAFAPEEDVFWGSESEWLKDDRHEEGTTEGTGLEKPLGAVQMGLIYVNPEGPGGHPDILASAKDIRETFSRMGMSDSETVALIAGGHTFGKAHGAADPSKHVGAEPEGAPVEQMGIGWKNSFQSGKGRDTITSGLEGAWTADPAKWDLGYFENLFKYDWTQTKSPGGATQWVPSAESITLNGGEEAVAAVPDAQDKSVKHFPIMFTTDLALRYDPRYAVISKRFHANLQEFNDAFKRAWYKLCHRDMGPKSRHLGPWVPDEDFVWLDPIPDVDHEVINQKDIASLKEIIIGLVNRSELSISDLVKAAWASASTYRFTDHRGGANGGRVRLEPQKNWEVNDPPNLAKVISFMEGIQESFNVKEVENNSMKRVSFADLIVLGGCVAIQEAARRGGHDIQVPFVPGRTDASQSETDVSSFNEALKPIMDGFRNFEGGNYSEKRPEVALVDRAYLLTLSAPEMVVLIGGLRVLNANTCNSGIGVLTERPEVLTNDFFVNMLDDNIKWSQIENGNTFQGIHSGAATEVWKVSRLDLIFGSNSQLRAISEAYACEDSCQHFLKDFVSAWNKVMMLDRFELIKEKNELNPVSKL